ncbi:MAG: CBS domain-containing protein [Chloroflexi bacterium]|nr:CBS domain-containing protein [Chloroflexota bacterium]
MQVILTHENTDFDALASMLAAWKLYPQAKPVLPKRLNRNLRDFLTLYWEELPFLNGEDLARETVDQAIVVDTQSYVQVRGMGPHTRIHIVDHHEPPAKLANGTTFSGDRVGATTTLLVEEITRQDLHLTDVEATLLALGIYEDTGGFTYLGTTPRDLQCASWLLGHGANLEVVVSFLRYPLTDAQREVYQQLVTQSEPFAFAGHSVILAAVQAPGFNDEISTLAHKLRDLFDPDALFLLVDLGDFIQLVARSSTENVDVAQIAEQFGGGGHPRAAAAFIRGWGLAEARQRLLGYLERLVQPSVTVREIMSYGVHTVAPEATVAEAAELMLRYGHEGFPVVQEGQVVGVLTRSAIDKAMHHRLEGAAVEQVMIKGAIAVEPGDSVETLQNLMMEHGVGQVPVVEGGQVIGIVTRTDLIKLWSSPRRTPPPAQRVTQLMREALTPPLTALLREVGHRARRHKAHVYAVGGVVRDLLLGSPNLDLDLVVEGDAIALARSLARAFGGRVRSHGRFGTAKWILEGEMKQLRLDGEEVDWANLPVRSLDFVTARTEFYAHPTALPQVERSSIKQDLHRRDFTINTLAISLSPDRFGELIDFYGGEQDLRRGVIRVLHSLSFVEDPTRMLRAVRLEQRLGFQIEQRTLELIQSARDLLGRTTGERLRHELYLILQEAEPEKALARLDELTILQVLAPGLRCDDWLTQRCQLLRAEVHQERWNCPSVPDGAKGVCAEALASCYLGLLAGRLEEEELERLIDRFHIVREDTQLLREGINLRPVRRTLRANHLRPSQVYELLAPFGPRTRFLGWLLEDSWVARQRFELFESRWQRVRPAIDGDYLKTTLGLKPGPLFRQILGRLRAARLDGEVQTQQEEHDLVLHLLGRGGELKQG